MGVVREVGGSLCQKREVCICDNYSVTEDTDTRGSNMNACPEPYVEVSLAPSSEGQGCWALELYAT